MVSTCRNEGDPFLDRRDPLVKAMSRAAHRASVDAAVAAERERCAKIIEAEAERILSKQKPDADPLGMNDTINLNLRMMAAILPELAAKIREADESR